MNDDPLKPSAVLLCKLGSIIVHFDETHSPDGRHVDLKMAQDLLADPEVQEWIKQMNKMAYLPVKRK